MKSILLAALAATVAATSAPVAFAQGDRGDYRSDRGGDHREDRGGDHRDDRGGDRGDFRRHEEWRRGAHMQREDWDRGRTVDWRGRHLRRPPRGYEWREVDGNYVLAAAATGLIASVIANSH